MTGKAKAQDRSTHNKYKRDMHTYVLRKIHAVMCPHLREKIDNAST